jgi:hypothetical protein
MAGHLVHENFIDMTDRVWWATVFIDVAQFVEGIVQRMSLRPPPAPDFGRFLVNIQGNERVTPRPAPHAWRPIRSCRCSSPQSAGQAPDSHRTIVQLELPISVHQFDELPAEIMAERM